MTAPVTESSLSPAVPPQVQAMHTAFAALDQGPLTGTSFAAMLATAQRPTTVAPTGYPSPATGQPASGSAIVSDAERYLGVPYQWGGTSPTTGFDCSGFTQHVFGDLGISLPRTAAEQQAGAGQSIPSLAQAQPGDLLFFGSPAEHVGIYVGNGQMINAPHTGAVVRIEPVWETPSSILRVTGSSGVTSPAAATGSPVMSGSAGLNPAVPSQYAGLFLQAGAKYGVSPSLLAAVAQAESGFNPGAVSPAGAIGLMQLMPGTAAGLGVDPNDPAQAIDGAARLLASNLHQFGSVELAVAAYNAGAGAVQRYGGVPPYPETEAYVTKVMSLAGAGG